MAVSDRVATGIKLALDNAGIDIPYNYTVVLSLPVAWNREKSAQSAGLRTFPLVAVASCSYVLIAASVLGGNNDSLARIIAGLITGIGFIGGGAILKERASVPGTATAASIWNTGAIGAAVAFSRYEIAIILSLINFATFRWLSQLKDNRNTQYCDNNGEHS